MGFFKRLSFGWRLAMTSLGVVARDKTLMLFPVLSGVASGLLILAFVLGIGPEQLATLAQVAERSASGDPNAQIPPVYYLLAFAAYFALFFITVYFNVALLGAARLSIEGRDTSLGDGLSVANQHLGKIIGWSLLSASIGLLLNILENNEKIGRFVAAILGTAWTVISYFAVPVMIFENAAPTAAIGRSARLMKATWGENVGAQFGIGLAMFGALILSVLLGGLGMFLLPQASIVLLPVMLISIPLILLLGTAAKSVLAVGLYEFATHDGDAGVFKADEMRAAFG